MDYLTRGSTPNGRRFSDYLLRRRELSRDFFTGIAKLLDVRAVAAIATQSSSSASDALAAAVN